MGRIYSISYQGTITAAGGNADLLELLPADDKPVRLRGFSLSQISEVGDAMEEGLRIAILRLAATVTSGNGTSVTPAPADSADAAFGGTAECNGATVGTTSGATTTLAEFGWNIRNSPFDFWFPDERFCPKVKQGEGLFVRMETTLLDDMSAQLTFWIEED